MNTSIKKLDDGRQTESMTSLFLSQSYQDAWDDYARSLKKEGLAVYRRIKENYTEDIVKKNILCAVEGLGSEENE